LKGHLLSHLLFEPITLRGLTVRNRIWVPPMCQYSVETDDGIAAPWHYVHYGSLARGGAGAVIVEATGVTRRAGSLRRILACGTRPSVPPWPRSSISSTLRARPRASSSLTPDARPRPDRNGASIRTVASLRPRAVGRPWRLQRSPSPAWPNPAS